MSSPLSVSRAARRPVQDGLGSPTSAFTFLFSMLTACAFYCQPADAASGPGRLVGIMAGAAEGTPMESQKDGATFVDSMYNAAAALNSYSFRYQMQVVKKKTPVVEEGNLYFKHPRLIRVEEIGPYKNGAIAVLGGDGKVRAHLGGALKYFVVTLDPHSSELRSANGYPMVDSDFLSLAAFLKNWVKEGIKARVTEKPAPLNGNGKPVQVLEMYKAEAPERVLKRVFVDPDSFLPVLWHDFQGGELLSVSSWSNVSLNVALSDELFKL